MQDEKTLKNILEEAIKAVKENMSYDTSHSKFLDKLYDHLTDLGYDFTCNTILEGEWIQNNKNQYLEGVVENLCINEIDFYVEFSLSRSGSPFSGWDYCNLSVGKLMTKKEYFSPKPVFSQKTKDFDFDFFDDETVTVTVKENGEKLQFVNFEFALKYIRK